MKEIWKDVKDYEGLYQVSNLGRIKRKSKIIKNGIDTKGYCYVNLSKNGIVKNVRVHRIVAISFIPNIENKKEINHIDGNKQNNCVSNLEWATHKENIKHAIKTNLLPKEKLIELSKLGVEKNKKQVAQIKNNVIIAIFDSTSKAYRITKIHHISCVANGNRNQAGGYQWKYIKKGD